MSTEQLPHYVAHILRPDRNEWCGATEPPTIVTVDQANAQIGIDIFEPIANLHVGALIVPEVHLQLFMRDQDRNRAIFTPERIQWYASRAIQAHQLNKQEWAI